MLFKGLLIFALLRLLKERSDTAMRSGLILSQAGEFGFVLVALGVSHQLITPDKAGLLVSIVVLTMVFTPRATGKQRPAHPTPVATLAKGPRRRTGIR